MNNQITLGSELDLIEAIEVQEAYTRMDIILALIVGVYSGYVYAMALHSLIR